MGSGAPDEANDISLSLKEKKTRNIAGKGSELNGKPCEGPVYSGQVLECVHYQAKNLGQDIATKCLHNYFPS